MANTTKYISLDKLGLYHEKEVARVNGLINNAKDEANAYAESLGTNYDVAGAAAGVQSKLDAEVTRATGREDEIAGLVATAQGDIEALAEKVGTVADGSTVVGMIDAVDAIADANAADITTMKGQIAALEAGTYDDTEVRGLIAGLEENKADKTQVTKDIEDAVKAEAAAREEAVAGVQGNVDTLTQTHATDKEALEDAIALKADQTALNAVSDVANAAVKQTDYDAKVAELVAEDARVAGLVSAEAERAAGAEEALDERLEKVEAFFELADGEKLDEAKDTLIEIQKIIDEDAAAADAMLKDIAANAKAIEDHVATDHDFKSADDAVKEELNAEIAKKADKTTVEGIDGRLTTAEGKITTVEGKVSTLEGKMTTVEGAVATKVEQSVYNAKVEELAGVDAGLDERLQLVEAQLGDGENSVSDLITDAKQEAIDAAAGDATTKANQALADAKAYADAEDAKIETRVDALEAASETHALASDVTALAGRVTTAEGEIDTLQEEMDTVEALAAANKAAHEANAAAIALKASQADLTKVSDRVTALETWHENFLEASQEEINGLFA